MSVTTPQEVFDAMASRPLPEQVRDVNATIQFDLNGDSGGQWYITLANGAVTVERGTAANANATVSMSAADYVAMVNGELHPMNAFMQGRIKVSGDMALIMRLQSLFARS